MPKELSYWETLQAQSNFIKKIISHLKWRKTLFDEPFRCKTCGCFTDQGMKEESDALRIVIDDLESNNDMMDEDIKINMRQFEKES